MTDHGLHTVHPVKRLERLCWHYPWSVLWVLATAGIAALVAGEYTPVAIILLLQAIIALHSIHRDRMAVAELARKRLK